MKLRGYEGYTGRTMAAVICMLRAVNVGGHNRIDMAALRGLCAALKLRDACTYVQSGNVIFRTEEGDLVRLAKRLQDAIEKKCGFRPEVILRTASEMREAMARNPFAKRRDIDPRRLLVTFFARDPGVEGRKAIRELKTEPDELHIEGRELYAYYPNGLGRPRVSWGKIEKTLGTLGTGRNWNSVTKMLEMAERLEAAE